MCFLLFFAGVLSEVTHAEKVVAVSDKVNSGLFQRTSEHEQVNSTKENHGDTRCCEHSQLNKNTASLSLALRRASPAFDTSMFD